MPTRSPEELRRTLQSASFDGDPEVLDLLRDEARRTVDQQVATLNDIDEKASRILRVNLVLVGLLVTALSYVSQANDVAVGSFENVYFGGGFVLLVLSSALAGLTYSASEFDAGVGSDNIAKTLSSGVDEPGFEELLLKNYAVRINFNRSTNVRNAPLITGTIVTLIGAIYFLSVGSYHAFYGPVELPVGAASLVVFSAYARFTGLPQQVTTAYRDVRGNHD
ncbi:hypothetical protein [Halobacterium hubeiense]|uniref:hypothetical protein n=1 Tax=Halobacterium hubeiense TaxID=1407499 RepID=UPI003C71EF14